MALEPTDLLLTGRLREAIASLRGAAPTHATQHNLAVALRATGAIDEALQHALAAETLAPRHAPTIALVGSLHSLAGDHASALAAFRRALAADPDHDVSRYYLAIALAGEGQREAALAELAHLGRDESRLPALVRERVRAQLSDLAHVAGPVHRDRCSVPLVTEIVAPTPRVMTCTATRPQAPGREITVDETRMLLARSQRVVALTGAGISSASGLPTRKELWQRHDRDDAVSIAQFHRDPRPLWTVIREFLADGAHAPNAAHRALAAMQLAAVITQNVEGLHQAAGTPCPIVELHGTLLETRCDACGARDRSCAELLSGPIPPPCTCGGVLRPDVVLFGEWVDRQRLVLAAALCESCDLLLVVGTAADVAPAADLPLVAAACGATVVEIKRQPSRLVRACGALHLAGLAEDVLPQLVAA